MSRPFLAFDLGGTRLKAGIVAPDGEHVLTATTAPTPDTGDAALALIADLGRSLLGADGCRGVGLAVPGIVDRGVSRSLPGKLPGLEGRDLRAELATLFGAPAVVANDAIAYALGEVAAGAARGATRAVVMTIGTGVGVGVVEHGRALGAGPLGGGILGGRIPLDAAAGPADTLGRSGTIEALCAARRIVDYVRDEGGSCSTVPDAFAALERGDRACRRGIDRFQAHLLRALVALVHAHAPSIVILGGGPFTGGGPLMIGLEDRLNDELWPGYPRLAVRPAALGDHAALIGISHLEAAA